jgi:hypothetical protein
MGQDEGNIYPMMHARGAVKRWQDTKLRAHFGSRSIDETEVISFWHDVIDARHNGTPTEWQDQVDLVAAEFSFTWDSEWDEALETAADMCKP